MLTSVCCFCIHLPLINLSPSQYHDPVLITCSPVLITWSPHLFLSVSKTQPDLPRLSLKPASVRFYFYGGPLYLRALVSYCSIRCLKPTSTEPPCTAHFAFSVQGSLLWILSKSQLSTSLLRHFEIISKKNRGYLKAATEILWYLTRWPRQMLKGMASGLCCMSVLDRRVLAHQLGGARGETISLLKTVLHFQALALNFSWNVCGPQLALGI